MRVLLLSVDPPPRGVIQSLAAAGVEPVVAIARGESETVGLARYERVTARGVPGDPIHLRWSRKALRTLVRDLRPELIHIVGDPWTPTAETGAAAARDLKIPYVLVGQAAVLTPLGLTARWQARRVVGGASGLAGASKPALEVLAGAEVAVPTAIIPGLGFEIPPPPAPRDPPPFPTIGVIGRVVPERGIGILLDALATLFGEWRLLIVGTGPAQEDLEAKAQRLGLSARIEWLGGLPRHELGPIWERLDVIAAPSRTTASWVEPTGSVVLEAMAHGIGAVVSRSGALPDVVGEGGMIVDEGDAEALARALSGLVSDPARCPTLGARGRQRVLEHFGDGPVAERTVAWWRRALGQVTP
ncbi:MAG: glycosyltransferase family 4 protein [Gemmatimonadales bacterium]